MALRPNGTPMQDSIVIFWADPRGIAVVTGTILLYLAWIVEQRCIECICITTESAGDHRWH